MATHPDAAFARSDEPALQAVAPGDTRADLGILCVHGIGVQAEGETVLAVAKPLLDAFAPDRGRVVYADAILKPTRQLTPGPAHLRATVEGGPPEAELFPPSDFDPSTAPPVESTRVLIAESWWAQSFDAPAYRELLGWLLSYGTWIAIRHTVFRLTAPIRWLERRYEARGKTIPDWLRSVDALFGIPGALISIVLVAVPFQLTLLAIGLLALMPLRATQTLARRAAMAISGILGDASVYTANDAIRATILARVRSDLAWTCLRSKRVVVLAHSQGAAVAFDLLRSMDSLDGLQLVTYGAGVRKLSELEEDARSKPLIVRLCGVLWLLVSIGLVMAWYAGLYVGGAVTTTGAGAPAGPVGDRIGSLLLFYLLVFVLIFLPAFFHTAGARETEVDKRVRTDLEALLAKGLRWSDLYATSDPVPGGPLLGPQELPADSGGWHADAATLPGYRSRPVVNRMSTFTDHTSYWNGPNDFLPALTGQLRDWLGLEPVGASWDTGRLRRVRYRKLAGLLLFSAAVAVFVRAGDPLRDLVFVPLWNLLPIEPGSRTSTVIQHYGLRPLAIGAAGLAANLGLVLLYCRYLLDPSWHAWELTVQRYRADAYAGADNLISLMARLGHATGPTIRMLLCTVLVIAPLAVLISIAWRSRFDPAVDSLIMAGEFGREAAGWFLLLLLALALVGLVMSAWERLRGTDAP